MGGCCYTPSHKDFLWWYWLLLLSIVGIPMLVAVLYVRGGVSSEEEEKRKRGRTAARIFWIGSVVVAVGTFSVVGILLRAVFPLPDEQFRRGWMGYWGWEGYEYGLGYQVLAVQFFLAFFMANAANGTLRPKPWSVRIPGVVLFVGLHLLALALTSALFRRPAVNVMQFMACMLPAHYWGNFKDGPDRRRAWKALLAFVVGATVFFLVSWYGEDFAQSVLGLPAAGKKA